VLYILIDLRLNKGSNLPSIMGTKMVSVYLTHGLVSTLIYGLLGRFSLLENNTPRIWTQKGRLWMGMISPGEFKIEGTRLGINISLA